MDSGLKNENKVSECVIPFEKMTYSDTLLLSFYALCDLREEPEGIVCNMLEDTNSDFKREQTHAHLMNMNLIQRSRYMFDTMDFAYNIQPEIMVSMIIWLFHSDEGNVFLFFIQSACKKFRCSFMPVQIPLIDYIRSDYKDVMQTSSIFANDTDYLLPVVNDRRFKTFLSNLSTTAFQALVDKMMAIGHMGDRIFDTQQLMDIALARADAKSQQMENAIDRLALYAFMTEGKTYNATGLITEESLKLQAVQKLYESDYKTSMALFHKAISQHNIYCSNANERGIFREPVINFLWVVCCHHDKSDEGKRIIASILRRTDNPEEVKAAWCLAAILTYRHGYVAEMRKYFTNSKTITRQLMTLIVRISGRKDILVDEAFVKYNPQWKLLKYENSAYIAMDIADENDAIRTYHARQVTSIYMKQQWEYVIENLIKQSKGETNNEPKSERLAYYMQSHWSDSCEVRLQTTLKNGGWSAGKSIKGSTFMAMSEKNLSLDDIKIRNSYRSYYGNAVIPIENVLPYMTHESRLYTGRFAPYTLMKVTQDMPYLIFERSDSGFNVKSNIDIDQIEKNIIITSRSVNEITFLKMTNELRPYFSQLLELGSFPLTAEDTLKAFFEVLRGKVEIHSTLIEGGSTLETIKGESDITIQMRPQGKEAYMVSIFTRPSADGNIHCVPGEGSDTIIDIHEGKRVNIERDLMREEILLQNLKDALGDYMPEEYTFQMDAYDLLPLIDFLRDSGEGYIVEWPEGQKLSITNRYNTSQWHATLKKNKNGWFEMEGSVQLDENTVLSMGQLMDLVNQNRGRFIRLSEGEYVALSNRLSRQLSALNAIASRSRNKLQMSPFSAALLDNSIIDGELHLEVDPELREIRQRILDSSNYKPDVPATLNATLRPYQTEGYQWIARLNSWGAGALLADDMGLGKTVQTIAYLLLKAEEGPALVVAPASVAPNWCTELQKFAPTLNIQMLNFASNRSTCIANAKAGDVIITTYGLLLSVKEEITHKQWTTVCLDEAHVIKNRGAKTSGVAMQLKSQYRIMLTGTPLQNHLGELWNLFQFVNPGLLGSYEDFGRRFITPIEVGKDKDRQKELDRIVQPFMLRRTKEKVLDELPEKTEIYQSVELSQEELAVYEVIRKNAEDMLEAEDSEKVSINTLAEITRLRQAACSAKLIEKSWKGKISKVEALLEALEPIVESGDAALVFSQFTSFLDIVRKALDKAKIPYLYIDGTIGVKQRQSLVEKFQRGECPVFLISLKAGGLGLNLTHANYVFHLDPWWNPAIEQQATDRAYRIGQRNAVTVYHLLSANTIEEKIRRMHETKRDLAENILDGTDMSSRITGKELLEMIR